jgi:hypothetical protein
VKSCSICGNATASLPTRAGSENLGCGKAPAARRLDEGTLFCASTFDMDTPRKPISSAVTSDSRDLKVVICGKSLVIYTSQALKVIRLDRALVHPGSAGIPACKLYPTIKLK